MKTMNYSIIRCICALVLGVLLVAWPEAAILYLVITIGALFLVPGLFSVFGYLTRGKQNGMSFPIAGLGRARRVTRNLRFRTQGIGFRSVICITPFQR